MRKVMKVFLVLSICAALFCGCATCPPPHQSNYEAEENSCCEYTNYDLVQDILDVFIISVFFW